jgi:hypothetical protein
VEGSGCSSGSSILFLHRKVSHIGGRVEKAETAQKEGWYHLFDTLVSQALKNAPMQTVVHGLGTRNH